MRPLPNLENLKKQAKLYLRWHRDRYFPVAAQIRAMLPRFRHLTGQDVLAHNFKSSDAQKLIAKKAGFENWEALLKGVNSMNDSPRLHACLFDEWLPSYDTQRVPISTSS